ncbi:hypothetical protein D3C87_1672560 [compost metagenome]
MGAVDAQYLAGPFMRRAYRGLCMVRFQIAARPVESGRQVIQHDGRQVAVRHFLERAHRHRHVRIHVPDMEIGALNGAIPELAAGCAETAHAVELEQGAPDLLVVGNGPLQRRQLFAYFRHAHAYPHVVGFFVLYIRQDSQQIVYQRLIFSHGDYSKLTR